jgi:hypothetical protein
VTPREPTNAELLDELKKVSNTVDRIHNHVVNTDDPNKGLLVRVTNIEKKQSFTDKLAHFALFGSIAAVGSLVWKWITHGQAH